MSENERIIEDLFRQQRVNVEDNSNKKGSRIYIIIIFVLYLVMGLALLVAFWFLCKEYELEIVEKVSQTTISIMVLLARLQD